MEAAAVSRLIALYPVLASRDAGKRGEVPAHETQHLTVRGGIVLFWNCSARRVSAFRC